MPTTLVLEYSCSRRINIPNELAEKLKENENAHWGEPWSWYVKWATLYYCDGDKKEHEINAEDGDVDYKRDDGQNWDDPEESEDEYNCLANGCTEVTCGLNCKCECTACQRNSATDDWSVEDEDEEECDE